MRFQDGIIRVPDILVPARGIDYEKWAVVACDQFTSDPGYWERVEAFVGSAPSSLSVVLPEVHLTDPEDRTAWRIRSINARMEDYLSSGVLADIGACMVLVRREVPGLPVRSGLVAAIDLEAYDYRPGNGSPIRASEGTVLERIPPRVRIRENAPLELPHVQLLMDDPENKVIDPLARACADGRYELLYDTPLMFGGGRLRGWRIPEDDPGLSAAMEALHTLDSWRRHGLLLAVGDGNHSLVTAKTCWERLRGSVPPDHPARFAMAEMINLHDDGLVFEPIHRVLFGCKATDFLAFAADWFNGEGTADGPVGILPSVSGESVSDVVVFSADVSAVLRFPSADRLAVDRIQPLVDAYSRRGGASVDYIHGESALHALAAGGATAIRMPSVGKDRFFEDILRHGVYPRKTFSMGEAEGKRYYVEARRIR